MIDGGNFKTQTTANIPREKEVPEMLAKLREAISRLDNGIELLYPVINETGNKSASEPVPNLCPLANEIRDLADRVERAANIVSKVEL